MKKIENKGVRIQFYPNTIIQVQVRVGTEPGEEQLRIIELSFTDESNFALTYDLDIPAEATAFSTDEATINSLLA